MGERYDISVIISSLLISSIYIGRQQQHTDYFANVNQDVSVRKGGKTE